MKRGQRTPGLLLACLALLVALPVLAQTATPANFGPDTFRFNDRYTTPFGPAYADIWLKQANFLACKPPLKQRFSYALCFFSGPAVPTPVPTDGGPSPNPRCRASSPPTASPPTAPAMRCRPSSTRR